MSPFNDAGICQLRCLFENGCRNEDVLAEA